MIVEIIALIISALVLAKAADIIVENSLVLAGFLNMNPLAIGFLLVSIATSLPELSIAITSVIESAPGVSAGNVLGANIADVTLVLGVAALVSSIKLDKEDAWRASNILTLAFLSPFLLVFFPGLASTLVLLLVFIAYAFLNLKYRREKAGSKVSRQNAAFAFFFFGIGVAFLLVSADFVVKYAVALAEILGLSSTIIGATIVSIGTTLPELSVSIQSMKKKSVSLAVGNAIGSTLVNSTLILGIASLSPLFSLNVFFSFLAVLFLTVSLIVTSFLHSGRISKNKGMALLVLFAVSLLLIISSEVFF